MTVGHQGGAPFEMRVAEEDGTVTIWLAGELDLITAPEVEVAAAAAVVRERLVLDLRELSFLDSSGVRLLMGLDLRSRAEGWELVVARRPGGPVERVLELCGFAGRVKMTD